MSDEETEQASPRDAACKLSGDIYLDEATHSFECDAIYGEIIERERIAENRGIERAASLLGTGPDHNYMMADAIRALKVGM